MANARKPRAHSSRTLQRLRQRLKEAEETLTAIRDGQVEALVIRSAAGEKVYTLRTADQPYRLMVEQMRESALTVAADGIILYCNQRFIELVSMPPERIVGASLRGFVGAEDGPKIDAMLAADQWRGEIELQSPRSAARPAQISSAAIVMDDLRTFAVVITDLTSERMARALRESNRLKDEFLATLSHELRTPLNVILGWTQMLLARDVAPAARQHGLELIHRNASAQTRLVNDLVDMSRIVSGKMHLDREALAIEPILQAAVESIRAAAQSKKLTIETSWSVDGIKVLADATRLQQVLWNLLSNAVKFTGAGGRIHVRASVVSKIVRIEVADSGIGIEPQFLPQIFDRFSQAESAKTRHYGGLGLGLSIVRDLIRMHGGDVSVESAGLGAGATFIVTLPLSAAPERTIERRASSATAMLAGHCIMLLEDHEDSRELFGHALLSAGAVVEAFGTAREAFDALARVQPSVIVADVGLPGEDGYSFIRRVRAHTVPAIRSVPAIAVTAYASDPDRSEALAAGFQHHLAKPIDPEQLVQFVHGMTLTPHEA